MPLPLRSLLCAVMLFAQAPADPEPVNQVEEAAAKADLQMVARHVEAALIEDHVTGDFPISVKLDESVVALEGVVSTAAVRERLSRVASRAAGKWREHLANRVRITDEDEDPLKPSAENAKPTALDDQQLQQLRDLVQENMPNAFKRIHLAFRVQPMPAIVLEGVMNNYDDKLVLNRLIRDKYRGLMIVNNIRVHVKPEAPPSTSPPPPAHLVVPAPTENNAIKVDEDTSIADRPLADDIVALLRKNTLILDAAIIVQVDQDVVWLRGSVQTPDERILAVNQAYRGKGVDYVIDDLTVNAKPGKATQRKPLASAEAVTYVRNFIDRRVSPAAKFDIGVVNDHIEVALEDSFIDDQERQVVVEAIEELSQELGQKIVVRLERVLVPKTLPRK